MTQSSFGGASVDEFDLTEPAPTVFQTLEDALSAAVKRDTIDLNIPLRPGLALRFDPTIEFELYQQWMKNASKGEKDGNINYMKLALVVISHTNVAVINNGREETDAAGNTYTVKSPRIHEMLKVPTGSVGTAIRRLYGNDGHVIQAMRLVLEKSGYSLESEVTEEDGDPLAI